MKWKMVLGLVIVAGMIAMTMVAIHGGTKIVGINTLDGGGGNQTDDGPHPPGPTDWMIWNPGNQVLDGPHPPGPTDW